MVTRIALLLALLTGFTVSCPAADPATAPAPVPRLSDDSPKDKPVRAPTTREADDVEKAIAPYIEKARKSYPDAKKRYQAGLPEGQHFFVVTKLKDKEGHFEQVFIAVGRIDGEKIVGRIANDLLTVRGFKRGDVYTFPEGELVDWLIALPDGTEEGNVVGKFIEDREAKRGK